MSARGRWPQVRRGLFVLAALGCGESPTAPHPVAPAQPNRVVARVNCVADTRSLQLVCAVSDSSSAAPALSRTGSAQILGDLIVGGQNQFITLTSSNVTYVSDVFQFSTTVQNLIGQKLATTDGISLDATGVRVFFEDLPRATSGTGTLDFVNPVGGGSLVDGFGNFTGTNQPYYQYNQILATGQTSALKTWRIHIPASVGTFVFSVYVSAPVQYPAGWIDVVPTSKTLRAGATQQLTATVRDVIGRTVSGATVTWGTSNAGVATVGANTGLVTAVADGAATITATSTTRTGSSAITVNSAAGAQTTITGAPPTLTVGSPATITVQAKDASGVNITTGGDAVVLAASIGSLSAVTDNANGTYTATLNSTVAGTSNITGTINTQTIGTPGAVTFTAGAAANMVKSAGDAQSAAVATAVAIAPSVTITDANGNPVSGVSVTFAVTGGGTGSGVTGTPATTNASGVATVGSWTLGNTAGSNSLSASSTGLTTVTFTATGTAGAPATATKQSLDPQTATAGTSVAVAPSVLIKDANNNPVPNVTVTFAVVLGGGSVTTFTPTTNVSGIATVGSWTLGTTAGTSNNTLSATSGTATTTFTATATASGASQVTINAGDAQTAAIGAAVTTAPSVLVRDQFNNPVSGVTVTFSVTGGAGGVASATPATNTSGIATVGSWTLGAGGAGCSSAAVTSCSRNTLHAAVSSGTNPSLDFKGYIPPTLPATATYQAVGNATLPIGSGIGLLQNALSINGNGANGTGATLTVTTPAPAGSQSGTVAIASDGSFSYLSSPTFVSAGASTEDFTYAVSDGLATLAANATLQVNVPEHVWYVRPGFTGTSTGADTKPFKDFSGTAGTGVEATAVASDTILVLTGTGTATGGTLKNSQFVYGQGASVAKTFTTGSAATYRNGGSAITLLAAGVTPQVGALTLASTNNLRGFAVTGSGITGTGFGTLTVSQMAVNASGAALTLTTGTVAGSFTSVSAAGGLNNVLLSGVGTSGAFALGSGSLTGATGDAFKVNGGAGSFTYTGDIATAATIGVNISAMTGGVVSLSGNLTTTSPSGSVTGVSITNNTGGTFTLSGPTLSIASATAKGVDITGNSAAATINVTPSTQLAITSTSGTGFNAAGAGTLNVTTGSSANTINSSTGAGIALSGVTIGGSGFTFGTVSSAGGTNNVSLSSLGGTGSIALGSGALSGASGTAFAASGGAHAISYGGTIARTSAGQLITVASRTGGSLTLSGNLSCTSSCGAAGGAIGVTSNTGGTTTFSGGAKTLSPASGFDAVTLSSNTGASVDFTLGGLAITTLGAGKGFTATSGGTITVQGGANTISAAAAQAIDFNAVTIGANGVVFTSVSSSASAAANIGMLSILGSGTIDLGGGALSGATGTAFSLSGGTGAVTYSGTISKTSGGRLVDISARTAGNVTLSGNLSCITNCTSGISVSSVTGGTVAFSGTTNTFTTTGGSAAVSLTSNPGATVNFSIGGLAISSGAGNAFTASGGGTVSVASGANPNTLVTTSGTPLNVQNVTIGATGLNFTSIATSGSATNGILLSNTGTGPLTVTGGGASDAANTTKGRTTAKSGGGTLTLGAGGTITGTTGTAVSLATTGPVTLQNMVIKSSLADGVNASSSTALTLDNTQVTTNTGFGVRTSSVASPTLQHMDITSNATLVDTTRYNAALLEVSGTATVQNSAFATSNNALLRLINLTANGTANVSNSGFTSSSISVGVEAFARNTGGLALTVQTGSFTNTRSGVTFLSSSSAASSFTVSSNNLQFSGINSAYGVSIVRDTGGAGLFTGTISSNTVGTGGVTNSGPWAGNAVDVTTRGNGGTIQVTITNNTIRQFGTHGIALTSGAASVGHTLETKIQGNNIANGEPTSLDGINVVPGTTPNTDRITACLNIGGTTGAQQNTVTNAVRQAIRVRPIGGIAPNGPPPTAIRLQNWDGSTAPATYLANQNPAATSAAAGGFANTGFTNSGSGATTLVGTCTTP